jgi:hypothetical protein
MSFRQVLGVHQFCAMGRDKRTSWLRASPPHAPKRRSSADQSPEAVVVARLGLHDVLRQIMRQTGSITHQSSGNA